MTHDARFTSQALRVINDAVIFVIGMTDLHVRKTPLPRRLASRARAQLRVLEQMLRRVIMLMALEMMGHVRSVPKMLARIRVISGAPMQPPQPVLSAPALAVRGPGLPPLSSGRAGQFNFANLPRGGASRPSPLHKFVARIIALQQILQNPLPRARRLAFYYDRLKRQKRAPLPPPVLPLKRGAAELDLIAGALPMELARALAKWPDTS